MNQSIISRATLSGMQYLIECAKSEGWNPGLNDAAAFYFTDPNGFFIEEVNNQPIGCISAVAYNDFYGFMGFYFVNPKFRHQGYGIKLWDQAISYLKNRAIGLDGVVAQQKNYQKSGFELYYNNIRYQGKPRGKSNKELQTLDTIPFQTLLDYDSKIYGLNRAAFLQHWVVMPNAYAIAKVDNDKLAGYGLIRKCVKGYKIGPLFANDTVIADQIFSALVHPFEGHEIYLDVIQTHTDAVNLAEGYGLKKVFETARMYKKTPPRQSIQNIFGVTSFELG